MTDGPVDVVATNRHRIAGAAIVILLSATALSWRKMGFVFRWLTTGLGLPVLWGMFFSLECYADICVLLATRTVPRSALVFEHPTKLGWQVTQPSIVR